MRYVPTLRTLVDVLYPPACLLCHTRCVREAGVCGACVAACRRLREPVCTRCGLPLEAAYDAQVLCRSCRVVPPAFEIARAAWAYTGPIQTAIQQFKYRRHWRIGRWLAEEMVVVAQRELPLEAIDAVLAVPMHWLKRRARGEDPSAVLARCVAGRLEKPYLRRALRKTRWTQTQTSVHGRDRFRNVREAYRATGRLEDGRFLLVDDVMTSGATADACARALADAGAGAVSVLTAARTLLG